jgi:DNA-3-methyladenine glycosylase
LLVYEQPGEPLIGRIVEAEAYVGVRDKACHGYGGHRSARNETMYGPAGHAYVFLIYGIHLHINLVASVPGDPSAVLLRAVEPKSGEAVMQQRRKYPKTRRLLTNGPGKLCQAFGLERAQDGVDLCHGELYLAEGTQPARVVRCPRIGVDYAGAWAQKPYRFVDPDSGFLSAKPR